MTSGKNPSDNSSGDSSGTSSDISGEPSSGSSGSSDPSSRPPRPGGAARPGGSGGSDPRHLRALAHPVRLDLLYLLDREGTLTASRAAELLGLTPKVCSYHLNQLGTHGVVEETGEGKGRSRPWRLAINGLRYVHEPDEEPATTRAEDAFARAMLARDARTVEAFITGRHQLPAAWRNVSTMSSNPLRLTPRQLRQLSGELSDLIERYRAMSREPAEGAHPVHTALYALPTDLPDLTD